MRARHEEGRREAVGFGLRYRAIRHHVLAMEDQVAQLMRGVKAAALTGFSGAQEDDRLSIPVKRVGVQFIVLGGQRVDPDPACFEQVQHVGDRAHPEPPAGPDDLRR
jgi:hypothetical protein